MQIFNQNFWLFIVGFSLLYSLLTLTAVRAVGRLKNKIANKFGKELIEKYKEQVLAKVTIEVTERVALDEASKKIDNIPYKGEFEEFYWARTNAQFWDRIIKIAISLFNYLVAWVFIYFEYNASFPSFGYSGGIEIPHSVAINLFIIFVALNIILKIKFTSKSNFYGLWYLLGSALLTPLTHFTFAAINVFAKYGYAFIFKKLKKTAS